MNNFKKILSLLLAGSMTLVMASCGNSAPAENSSTSTSTSTSTEAPASDDAVQELNLTFTDLKTLDVNDVRNANEFQILSHVHEGLFRAMNDENGVEQVQNAGCETYTVSEDGTVYTFTLRDQKWSDGQAITAQQYVDSIVRLLNPDNAYAYAFLAYDILNAREYYAKEKTVEELGVKAIDEKTLEITLAANIPFFVKKLTSVAFFPVRLDIIESASESYQKDFTKHVFSGPFVIESRILENEMVLTKNPNFWDAENVKLEKVTFKVVGEAATQSLLLESKELDAAVATTEYIEKWKKMDSLTQIGVTSPSCNYVCFNQHTGGPTGLMNNSKVKLAFSLALDREEMNEVVYNGIHTPAYGLIPYGLMVGDKEFRTLNKEPLNELLAQYDTPEKLQALLKEGMTEAGVTTDPSEVEFTIISSGSSTQGKAIQEFLKQTWENKLGIKVHTNILSDSSLFVEERNNNRYDLVFMGWNGDYNDPMTFMELFNSASGYAKFMGGYNNEEFDAMFNSLNTESDSAKRAETYIKMENNLVAENAGIAPVYFKNNQFFVQNYVKNLTTPMFGCEFEFSRAYIQGK